MLGVNVAKSSLHLHFLKTLESRTDVSVTSMPGVAGAGRPGHFTPTVLPCGGPAPETQNDSLLTPLSIPQPSRLVHAYMTFGLQILEGLCASTLLGQISLPRREPGRQRMATGSCPSLDPWGSQVLSPPSKLFKHFCFVFCFVPL